MKTYEKSVYVVMAADLLHAGHINVLKIARQKADELQARVVVGLLTDSAIAEVDEPAFLDYNQRKEVLENLKLVDEIIPQETFSYIYNLNAIKPILVIHGDDWQSGYLRHYRNEVIEVLHTLYPQQHKSMDLHPNLLEIPYSHNINALGIKKALHSLGISTNARQSRLRKLLTLTPPPRIAVLLES